MREEQELPYNGETAVCQESGEGGGDCHQAAVALQEECPFYNYGQRGGVLPAPEDSRGAEDHGLFRRQLRLLAERGHRERQQADTAIHVQLKINRRPREKLNFSTPKDEFFRLLL